MNSKGNMGALSTGALEVPVRMLVHTKEEGKAFAFLSTYPKQRTRQLWLGGY